MKCILLKMPKTSAPRRRKIPFSMDEMLSRLEEVHGRPRLISRFDPMDELVSCILSQHSSDASSFPAFTRLRQDFPEWEDIVEVGPEGIVESIRKAGLANQKSKSIYRCLVEIKERTGEYSLESLRGMEMMEARKWLMELPGVGPKTASIVLCFSFGMGAIPVDTHIFRVSKRLGILPEKTDENKAHDQLLLVVSAEDAFRYHTTLIQHGRQTCKAPIPLCDECVVKDLCPWLRKVGPEKERVRLARARKAKKKR
jgi:endonuclease-3